MDFLIELNNFLSKFPISDQDYCIVGSGVLGRLGVRDPHDLDIIVKSKVRNELSLSTTGKDLSENIDVQIDWALGLGLTDDQIISDTSLHELVGEHKFVRKEIHFANALSRRRETDIRDISIYQSHIIPKTNWDWAIIDKTLEKSDLSLLDIGPRTDRRIRRAIIMPSLPTTIIQFIRHRLFPFIPFIARKKLMKIMGSLTYIKSNIFSRNIFSKDNSRPVRLVEVQVEQSMHPGSILGRHFDAGEFQRYDVVLRCMVAESILNSTEDYFEDYKKMQFSRVGNFGLDNLRSYRDLVESMSKNGFDERYRLQLSRSGRLSDKSGAHRFACSLALGLERVPVSFLQSSEFPKFPISWFESIGIAKSTIEKMETNLSNLLKIQGVFTVLIIWPDARVIADQIESYIDSRAPVVEAKEIHLAEKEFKDFARRVYSIDDVDFWKPEYKISRMASKKNIVRVLLVNTNYSSFRQKELTRSYLSVDSEKLKSEIRSRFSSKIEHYFYDNLVHTGDNHIQNSRLFRLIWGEN